MCSLTRNSIMFVCCGTLHPNSYPKTVVCGRESLLFPYVMQVSKRNCRLCVCTRSVLQSSKFQCNNALCFKKYRFFCVPSCSKCLLHFLSTVPTSGLGDLPTLISNGQLSAFCGPLKLCVARSVMGCSLDLYK